MSQVTLSFGFLGARRWEFGVFLVVVVLSGQFLLSLFVALMHQKGGVTIGNLGV